MSVSLDFTRSPDGQPWMVV